MIAETTVPQRQISPTELVNLSEKDLAETANFIAVRSGGTSETVESHLRWFLLQNPARRPQDPLGFGLRAADKLVGCILCSPQGFRVGADRILFMGSSSFYVDPLHRGQGGRIFLQYCRLGKEFPLFGTSANAEAAGLWRAAGASPIPYSEGELFGVLRWAPVAEEFAHRRNANKLLRRVAGSPVANIARLFQPLKIVKNSSDSLRMLTSAEQVSDLLIENSSAKLTVMRDLPYIRWRYFSGRDATTAAFAFRHEIGRQTLVTVNQRVRGYRGQIKTLNVLDIYPEATAEEWVRIVGALIAHYKNEVDAIVLRSQSPDRQWMFCEKGFRWRAFDAPLGWFLDKGKRLQNAAWYPVPADGDGLI
jgi:hypothetical protein